MKTIEQLEKLSKNPFYTITQEEAAVLNEDREKAEPVVSSVSVDNKKKESQVTLGDATVKETGKLEKHPSDPVSE